MFVEEEVNFSIERFIKRLKQHNTSVKRSIYFSIERFIKRLKLNPYLLRACVILA